jgi:hypothetical protein
MLYSPLVFYYGDIIDDPPALILYRECHPDKCGNTALEEAVALALIESAAPDMPYTRSVGIAGWSCGPHVHLNHAPNSCRLGGAAFRQLALVCPVRWALLLGPRRLDHQRHMVTKHLPPFSCILSFVSLLHRYMWYDNNYCPNGEHGAGISNYGLATSKNGVHWVDEGINMSPWGVNPCSDPTFNKSIPIAGIGSGSCWESPKEKGK